MSVQTTRYMMTAAALFRPKDRVRMRTGFFEGEEGVVVESSLMVHIKLDNLPQAMVVGWNQIDNLTKPLTPYRYSRHR